MLHTDTQAPCHFGTEDKIVDEVLPNTGMEATLVMSSKPYSIFMSSHPKDVEKL